MAKNNSIKVGRLNVEITHPEKIIYPKSKISKADIIEYYYNISDVMMPLIKNKPISMLRYPNGIDGEGFYQKNAGQYFPDWVTLIPIKRSDGKDVNYVVIDKPATLIYLANQLCLIPHPWLSTINHLNYPDRMIFDLDPSGKKFDFNQIRITALAFKHLLEEIGLIPFVMTTGSRGLHVVVPLDQKNDFDFVRDFAYRIALFMEKLDPLHLTTEIRKVKRGKKIFVDYLRNAYTATSVAPYALRAIEGAPVATPIDWKEVEDPHLVSTRYTYQTVFDRLKKKGDPWKDINKSARSLNRAQKLFVKLMS